MTRRRSAIAFSALALVAAGVTACGSEGIELDRADGQNASLRRGAELFSQRCGGCHTLDSAGTQGSATTIKDRERVDGPNFNVRTEEAAQVLFAIRNGGYSGAIMPQNIVVGPDAQDVARFLARYAGRQARSPKLPSRQTQPLGGKRRQSSGEGQDEPQGGANPGS